MKNRIALMTLALAGILSVWLVMAGPTPAPQTSLVGSEENLHLENNKSPYQFHLDHYKVYLIEPQPLELKVYLQDQFDVDGDFKSVKVRQYERFLNPVDKNGEGIIDKHAHLNWYFIDPEFPDPTRKVTLYNQFGLQTIKIGRAVGLLVPTEKIEPGSEFPGRLDHYKVYLVLDGQPIFRDVSLKDQFHSSGNFVQKPVYFAVPVAKRHQNYYPINNKEDHLIFYTLDPRDINEFRETKDQFGLHIMKTRWCELLGVPSKKLAWSE